MTRSRLAIVSLCLIALVGCGGEGSSGVTGVPSPRAEPSPIASETPAADDVVEVLGTTALRFVPGELTATVGVLFKGRFAQRGAFPHNIEIAEFGVKGDDTTTLEAGDKKPFSFTPSKAGRFDFICTFHPQMKGTLTVS